jgi:tetratricopeptide (TPR) repeat protein
MLSAHPPVTENRRRSGIAAVLALCLFAAGCAHSAALRRGIDAEHRQDFDFAVVEYTKALRLRPEDGNTRAALERAKLRASQEHFSRARRLAATGKVDQALVEYELAAELNPTNGDIDAELR